MPCCWAAPIEASDGCEAWCDGLEGCCDAALEGCCVC